MRKRDVDTILKGMILIAVACCCYLLVRAWPTGHPSPHCWTRDGSERMSVALVRGHRIRLRREAKQQEQESAEKRENLHNMWRSWREQELSQSGPSLR